MTDTTQDTVEAAAAWGAWNERQRIIALAEKHEAIYLEDRSRPDRSPWLRFADLLRKEDPGA